MSDPALTDDYVLHRAMDICGGKQAEVALATRTAPSSVSRWLTRRSRPEVEAALRLAKLTQLPRVAVLAAFGYDAADLGIHDDAPDPEGTRELASEIARLPAPFREWVATLLPKLRALPRPPGFSASPSDLSDECDDYVYQTKGALAALLGAV